MRKEIKEVQIEIQRPTRLGYYFKAVIRNGRLKYMDKLDEILPEKEEITAYILFCHEVLAELED